MTSETKKVEDKSLTLLPMPLIINSNEDNSHISTRSSSTVFPFSKKRDSSSSRRGRTLHLRRTDRNSHSKANVQDYFINPPIREEEDNKKREEVDTRLSRVFIANLATEQPKIKKIQTLPHHTRRVKFCDDSSSKVRSTIHITDAESRSFFSEDTKPVEQMFKEKDKQAALIFQNAKHVLSTKKWLKGPEMLIELERFTKNQISKGINEPERIVNLFIKKSLLQCLGIREVVQQNEQDFLKDWVEIDDTAEFLDKIDKLEREERRNLLIHLGGERMITFLKKCKSNNNRVFWISYVQNLIGYYGALAIVLEECFYLPTYFDWKLPISSIKRENILSTFEMIYDDSFIETKTFFTINKRGVSCPDWRQPPLNSMDINQRKIYFFQHLIEHLYEALDIHKDYAIEHATLICHSTHTKREKAYLIHILDHSFNDIKKRITKKFTSDISDIKLFMLENMRLIINKLSYYACVRPFEIHSDFVGWAKERLSENSVLKEKLDAAYIVQNFVFQLNYHLTQEEIFILEDRISKAFEKSKEYPQQDGLFTELDKEASKHLDLGRQFYHWSLKALKKAAEQESFSTCLIVERYLNELWHKNCNKLPCFHILQALSFSSYFHAHKLLRKHFSQLLSAEAGEPRLQNFPQDRTTWQIHILENNQFSLTHVKPYRFVIRDKIATGKVEYQDYGNVEIHWTLNGNITEPIFSARLQMSNVELFEKWPLEVRTKFLSGLTIKTKRHSSLSIFPVV